MKTIKISGQIVLLFVSIFLFSVTAFSIITLTRVHSLAEEETYTRLITYSTLVNNLGNEDNPPDFRDMEIAFIRKENGDVHYSRDLKNYINEEEFEYLINLYDSSNSKKPYANKFKNNESKTIYFVIYKDAEDSFTMVITSSRYVGNLVRRVSLQFILVFFTILVLSILVIAIWGNEFKKRISKIQDHLLNLPKTGYSEEYVDTALDEIGELSKTVEEMRKEIQMNEATKQEMLQNISHDFKTPISVIKSYAEAQQDGMVGEESSKIIINQAELLKNKVERLLQYNSLEYLDKKREFEDVNMKDVIEEVLQEYRFQTTLQIVLDLADDVYFKGYFENYCTVVSNILDNAKRYAKTMIKIVLKKDRLRIYNDGESIDEQFLKHSFKPYEKGNKGEFGLGMSIVKKTVEFFGMELIAKNETIGVSFIITKPKG